MRRHGQIRWRVAADCQTYIVDEGPSISRQMPAQPAIASVLVLMRLPRRRGGGLVSQHCSVATIGTNNKRSRDAHRRRIVLDGEVFCSLVDEPLLYAVVVF